MKFPLISRSRHDAEVAGLEERIAKLECRTQEKLSKAAGKIEHISARRRDELRRLGELEQLCEDRLREIGTLRSEMNELRRSRMSLLDQQSLARAASVPYRGKVLPVILGIDVEPDARVVDLSNPSWQGTVSFFSKLPDFRDLLRSTAGGTPVRLTWFPRADPQVEMANKHAGWALEHFAADWRNVTAAGDEIGLHMHPWRWDAEAGEWCQDHADEEWVVGCLRSSIAAVREAFGATPACYRGGDRYLSGALVRVLEDEGVRVDLTLERMPEVSRLVGSERGTGVIPDGSRVPLQGFRPSTKDFRVPDPGKKDGLGMLPLTAAGNGSLSPWFPNTLFEEALDQLLEAPENLTHLAFVARSNIADLPEWENFVENSLSLARRVREGRLVFMCASEAWDQVSARL